MAKLQLFTQTLTSPVYLVNEASSWIYYPQNISCDVELQHEMQSDSSVPREEEERITSGPHTACLGSKWVGRAGFRLIFTPNIWLTSSSEQTDRSSLKTIMANDMTVLFSWPTMSWRGKRLLWNSAALASPFFANPELSSQWDLTC